MSRPSRFLWGRRRFVLAAACLTVIAGAVAGFGRSNESAEPQHLHVIVDRLPQCDYGVGYEQPLRIDLLDAEGVVATVYHSGIYTGEESIQVPLHVPLAYPGRYRIRFGRCPSLIDDPLDAVACEDVDWVRTIRGQLRPSGIDEPQVVRDYRLRADCLDASPVSFDE